MKMIWVTIRSEYVPRVLEALDRAGIGGMTRLNAAGPAENVFLSPCTAPDHGREILMIAVPDSDVAKVVTVIRAHARPEGPGRNDAEGFTDGKIFVTYIDEWFTIRTARTGAEPP